jgi:hypothetical protein
MTVSVNLRRTAAGLLLAAILAAGTATHHHFGLADEGEAGKSSESILTRHDPLSRAFHWHAILKIVQEEPCWVCHWNRLFGLGITIAVSLTPSAGDALALLPPRAARSVARFTRLSRGPPSLL